jgi:hypothetical protein
MMRLRNTAKSILGDALGLKSELLTCLKILPVPNIVRGRLLSEQSAVETYINMRPVP